MNKFTGQPVFSWPEGSIWMPLRRLINRHRINAVQRGEKIPVLVYQMGKVASKTIYATLQRLPDIQPFHIHTLNPVNMDRRKTRNNGLNARQPEHINFQLWRSIYQRLILEYENQIKIITLIREPVGRNISAFFQGLDMRTRIMAAHKRIPMSQLIDKFQNHFPHVRPLVWFDKELLEVTGINVYEHTFPKEQGYQRIMTEKFDLLILRHDLPDNLKARCLGDFLSGNDIRIVPANLSDKKIYRDCYLEFQRTINLSTEYVSQMLDSRYARHFFTDEELESLKLKWLRQNQLNHS